MHKFNVDADIGNHEYQQGLAQSLVASLGADSALDFCVQNGWNGVYSSVAALARSKSPTTPSPA